MQVLDEKMCITALNALGVKQQFHYFPTYFTVAFPVLEGREYLV